MSIKVFIILIDSLVVTLDAKVLASPSKEVKALLRSERNVSAENRKKTISSAIVPKEDGMKKWRVERE